MKHILVVRGGALGDGLLTLPALAALRTRWPVARLTLVGPRTLLPFACAAGLADEALPIEDQAGLTLMTANAAAPAWVAADLAVVWLKAYLEVARRLAEWSAGEILAGPSVPPVGEAVHVTDQLFQVLAARAIGPSCLGRPLAVPAPAIPVAQQWWHDHPLPADMPIVALHPGSGGRHKCWPPERYLALAQRLTAAGKAVLICLGPAEAASLSTWQHQLVGHPACRIASDLDLAALAGVLRRCSGFIGNDAGVTHLAAALGLPTVAIFGPTDSGRWAPVGRAVRVMRDPGWVSGPAGAATPVWQLTAADVLEASTAMLATVPRQFHFDTGL